MVYKNFKTKALFNKQENEDNYITVRSLRRAAATLALSQSRVRCIYIYIYIYIYMCVCVLVVKLSNTEIVLRLFRFIWRGLSAQARLL